MKRRVLSILILGANLLNVAAQNMTSSPVSMFGLGELSTGEGGIYSGLGGVGIALRGENVVNSANPASLTGLLPQYFFFDLYLHTVGNRVRWDHEHCCTMFRWFPLREAYRGFRYRG